MRANEIDLSRINEVTPEVDAAIDDLFDFKPWNTAQQLNGVKVREVLAAAVKVIIKHVPPHADRTAAIRKIREARMDCNSAITHGGR